MSSGASDSSITESPPSASVFGSLASHKFTQFASGVSEATNSQSLLIRLQIALLTPPLNFDAHLAIRIATVQSSMYGGASGVLLLAQLTHSL